MLIIRNMIEKKKKTSVEKLKARIINLVVHDVINAFW